MTRSDARDEQSEAGTEREERFPRNVGRAERMASIALGSLLTWRGLRQQSALGRGLGAVGLALTGRGVTGRCPVYRAAGVDTSHAQLSLPGLGRREAVVERRITISALPEPLYERWRALERLPQIFEHLESVEQREGNQRSHWVAKGPLGARIEWDAEITDDRPGERIAWRSTADSPVQTEGEVRFEPAPTGRGTELTVKLCYRAPAGAVLAPVFARLGDDTLREELRGFKRQIETGETPTTEGQPHGRSRSLFPSRVMKKVRAAGEADAQRRAS